MTRLEIESLAAGGDGVGHAEGLAVFVPGTAPGDTVEVALGKAGQGRVRCEMERIVTEGPGRVVPPCPRADRCGGCQWQHVDYPIQVEAKEAIVERALKIAGIATRQKPMVRAQAILGYRRRARLRWEKQSEGIALGFVQTGTHRVVDVIDDGPPCPVLAEPLRQILPELRRTLSGDDVPGSGLAQVVAAGDDAVHVAFVTDSPFAATGRLERLALRDDVAGVGAAAPDGFQWFGASTVNLEPDDMRTLYGSATAFAQANAEMNRHLANMVSQSCGREIESIVEIFAGAGNFTRELSNLATVTAVERSGLSCRLLRKGIKSWQPPFFVRVLQSDARRALKDLNRRGAEPDCVVLDPPRQGCRELIPALTKLDPDRVVYVSCDAMTLGRDLKLLEKSGYRTRRVTPLDTMPMTAHFEMVSVVDRTG